MSPEKDCVEARPRLEMETLTNGQKEKKRNEGKHFLTFLSNSNSRGPKNFNLKAYYLNFELKIQTTDQTRTPKRIVLK